jgi:DNA-directed RNA polymerase subunit beta'
MKQLVADDTVYRSLRERFGDYFDGGMGAEAIKRLLIDMDTVAEAENLKEIIETGKGTKKLKAIKRLKVVANFAEGRSLPTGMVLDAVPVIPPDLRPMVQLTVAASRPRPQRPVPPCDQPEQPAEAAARPAGAEIIVNNEKRMLQEAATRCSTTAAAPPGDGSRQPPVEVHLGHAQGKQGRFRQNLLGKRVDYSGRSVIVVGPELRLHQWPAQADGAGAVQALRDEAAGRPALAQNIKSAKRMVERARPAGLGRARGGHPRAPGVPNRAPTLHRLASRPSSPCWSRARRSRSTCSCARRSTPTSTGIRWRCTCRCPPRRRPRHGS